MKYALLAIAIFGVVGAVMIVVWSVGERHPDGEDLVVYLIALPTLLWISLVFVFSFRDTQSPAWASSEDDAETAIEAQSNTSGKSPPSHLSILAGAMKMPHGNSAAELFAAIGGALRPTIDPALKDVDGFPILTARIDDTDEQAQRELVHKLEIESGGIPLDWSPEQIRALSHAYSVVAELSQIAAEHPALAHVSDSEHLFETSLNHHNLQLLLVHPPTWGQKHRVVAERWLLQAMEQQGLTKEKLTVVPRFSSESPEIEPMAFADRLALQAQSMGEACLAILLAYESFIGEKSSERWLQERTLFTHTNEAGRIPGEGAAGLLLASASEGVSTPLDSEVRLLRTTRMRRSRSADSPGRIHGNEIEGLVQDALSAASLTPNQITAVTSDSDHRASRMGELLALGNACLPELDHKAQFHAVAVHCGYAGAVSSLAALVLAYEKVAAEGGQILCISNSDPYERAVTIVSAASKEIDEQMAA